MGKGGKSSLKSALKTQQSRLEKKQKSLQAAQLAETKYKRKENGKPKGKPKADATAQQTTPFRATDNVLLIGEGNFSFARALVRLHNNEAAGGSGCSTKTPPGNITATAYDSEKDCYAKYPGAKEVVDEIKKNGVEVLFGVDATKLEKISGLKGRRFDRIIWNFPHAGKGITDQDRNILSNQLLILAFLRSAAGLLAKGLVPTILKARKKKKIKDDDDDDDEAEGETIDMDEGEPLPFSLPRPASETVEKTRGTILITLRNVSPYTLWEVPRLAKKPPPPNPKYIQLRSFPFIRDAWPEYEHRMTKGERAHGTGTTGEGGEDRTWEFCLCDP